MGIGKIFEVPDLSNLLDGISNIRIDKVLHKAFIEVNEKGTEAAASTYMKGLSNLKYSKKLH
jgi:serine protease inhibitor